MKMHVAVFQFTLADYQTFGLQTHNQYRYLCQAGHVSVAVCVQNVSKAYKCTLVK